MTSERQRRVLLTGATGFVGRHLDPSLGGFDVRRASRHPPEGPGWIAMDLDDPRTIPPALEGVDTVVYLVHGMRDGAGYAEREHKAATALSAAAMEAGVAHIVYLGGVMPREHRSAHLESRRATGDALRSGGVPVTELRAGMIIGEGSASWEIVRDLASRLPAMIYPAWLRYRMEPVAIDDVVAALVHAIRLGPACHGIHDLPGPERLSGEALLARASRAIGLRPYTIRVPMLTPRLSAYWLRFVSPANTDLARELVEGLSADLVAEGDGFWKLFAGHERLPLDTAIRQALRASRDRRSRGALTLEWLVQKLGRPA